jgi:SPP1 gp7 family putative phage head morphogenesis protein
MPPAANNLNALIEIRVRRAMAIGSGRRLRRREKIPTIEWPRGARLLYLQELRRLLRRLRDAVDRAMTPAWPGGVMRFDAPGDPADIDLPDIEDVLPEADVEAVAVTVGRKVSDHNKVQVNKQLRSRLGIDFLHHEPELQEHLDLFTRDNVRLIRRLTTQVYDDVQGAVLAGARTGTRVEDLQEELEQRFGFAEKRAALIARDQVGKLNSELTQLRHEAVGVVEYVWSTSRDERVRPDHAALDDKTFRYDAPPIVDRRTGRRAHPGGDIQCRCGAIPVMDDLFAQLERMEAPMAEAAE